MQKRQLGANGPMVSAIGLGCMSFGGIFGPTTESDSFACLDAAWDHGIDFLDIANIYGNGFCETIVSQWLNSRHRPVHLATKAGITGDPTQRFNNSEAYLRAELEGSLRRLGVDHVALFYLHRRDEAYPVEAVAETMARLIAEGKIGGYGLSEVSPGTLRRAHAVHPCAAVQNEYSLWTRQPELGLLQTCAELGTAFVPFAPLARGALGRSALDVTLWHASDFRHTIPRFNGKDWPLNTARLASFAAFAQGLGHSPPALALAWILSRGDHLIPIPGTRNAAHLADWAAASAIKLDAAQHAAIAAVLPTGWAYGDRYGPDQASTVERYC